MLKLNGGTPHCYQCGLIYIDVPNHVLPGKGNNVNPKIIMIGEAPGKNEVTKGEIFIGRAGKLLNKLIGEYEDYIYITNTVKCYPPLSIEYPMKAFRVPKYEEINICSKSLLLHEITKLIKNTQYTPIIMPLGNTALKALFGKDTAGITSQIDDTHTVNLKSPYTKDLARNLTVIPNYHPSYVLRNSSKDGKIYNKFIYNVKKAIDIYEHQIT